MFFKKNLTSGNTNVNRLSIVKKKIIPKGIFGTTRQEKLILIQKKLIIDKIS